MQRKCGPCASEFAAGPLKARASARMMLVRAGLALLFLVATAVFAQQVPELRYDPPPNFYHSAIHPPEDFSANGFNASLQVYPFRQFDGNIEQMFQRTMLREWIDSRYQEANVAGPPDFRRTNIRGAQAAYTARFAEAIGGMQKQRLRMLLVVGNYAAIVDASANSPETWQRAVPPLNAFSASLRVESGSAAPAVTEGAGAAGVAIAGLYMGTKPKYVVDLNKPVGYGKHVPALHYYLLSADGRVYRAFDMLAIPGGDVRRFDFDAAQRADPGNSGRYSIKGNAMTIQIGGQPPETILVAVPKDNRVTIDTVLYIRQ